MTEEYLVNDVGECQRLTIAANNRRYPWRHVIGRRRQSLALLYSVYSTRPGLKLDIPRPSIFSAERESSVGYHTRARSDERRFRRVRVPTRARSGERVPVPERFSFMTFTEAQQYK